MESIYDRDDVSVYVAAKLGCRIITERRWVVRKCLPDPMWFKAERSRSFQFQDLSAPVPASACVIHVDKELQAVQGKHDVHCLQTRQMLSSMGHDPWPVDQDTREPPIP